MKKKLYLTTTLPYANADPHMGFALEIIQADCIARYAQRHGGKVFFNTGTDEHGLKIYRKALEAKKDPQAYVDGYAERFKRLRDKHALNANFTNFIRTTDKHHIAAAEEFWRRCAAAGDIYKRAYKIKYCVGCELEKQESELEGGVCPLHPNEKLEIIEEENYFFRFSKYQKPLLELYEKNTDFVIPQSRLTEIKKFVERGLEDFSISRLKEKMPWGIGVPGDPEQVMYVWFDALVNYVSAVGWPDDEESFGRWWPVVQIAGKDNLRQQAAMWQTMLMSAGIPPSEKVLIHGFITSGGRKMSKSTGNVVDPMDTTNRYGTDALRYFLLREVQTFEDSDFTEERFKEAYNANLANGLGNLASRIMKMAEVYLDMPVAVADEVLDEVVRGKYEHWMERFELQKAADVIWERIGELDRFIAETKPFKTIAIDENKAKNDIVYLVAALRGVAHMLAPFLPESTEKIERAIAENAAPKPLFKRII